MNIKNFSILKKVGVVMTLMSLSAVVIAGVGAQGLSVLGSSLKNTGAREEVAREAMDLRVDIIAISRMTYQLAMAPEKAADFAAETEKRAKEMLDRLPKIAATADAEEQKQLADVRTSLASYFDSIRAMVKIAGSEQGKNPAVLRAALDKALDGQKAVTAAVKVYSTYSSNTLATARADALADSRMTMTILLATALVCIGLGIAISFLVARRGISAPIRSLTAVMTEMANGNVRNVVIDTDRADEIGEMARALEIFRANELHMREMEAQEQALNRQSKDLQQSISGIVAAAAAGDFSQRITKTYEDADLTRFASGVNELVENVDRGINEVRRVIAALADQDLTQDMQGISRVPLPNSNRTSMRRWPR